MQLITTATSELPQITWQLSGLETATGIDTDGVNYIGIPTYNNSGQWTGVEDIDEQPPYFTTPDQTDPEEWFYHNFRHMVRMYADEDGQDYFNNYN